MERAILPMPYRHGPMIDGRDRVGELRALLGEVAGSLDLLSPRLPGGAELRVTGPADARAAAAAALAGQGFVADGDRWVRFTDDGVDLVEWAAEDEPANGRRRGHVVAISGLDGAGKSSQAD